MLPAATYVRFLAWHRAGLYEADTESQLRTRWAAYVTVRANALAAHHHLTI